MAILLQLMSWCRQARSQCLKQRLSCWWPRMWHTHNVDGNCFRVLYLPTIYNTFVSPIRNMEMDGECAQHGSYKIAVCCHYDTDNFLNTLRPTQNGRHFPDDIFKWLFLNVNGWIPIKISLKFVRKGPVNNIAVLVEILAWRRSGDKPLSETMVVILPTHICVTRPQWVKIIIIVTQSIFWSAITRPWVETPINVVPLSIHWNALQIHCKWPQKIFWRGDLLGET